MTMYLIDLADPYQAGIDLKKVRAAGFRAVNIKTSQGVGYTNPRLGQWVREARAAKLALSTFHWLDNSASGAAQAKHAYDAMRAHGAVDSVAHQCDTESNASWAIVRDYVHAMQDKLGRPIALYTGDWWWTARFSTGSELTKYLWAPPNDGYLSKYPGDGSAAWRAGYGGWPHLSLLQYAANSLSATNSMRVSKTAVRDPAVWAALTGGEDMPLTAADAKTIWNADIAPEPSTHPDDPKHPNPTWSPVNMLRSTWDHAHLADKKLDTVTAQLAALTSAVKTLAEANGQDPEKVYAAIQAGARDAVAALAKES